VALPRKKEVAATPLAPCGKKEAAATPPAPRGKKEAAATPPFTPDQPIQSGCLTNESAVAGLGPSFCVRIYVTTAVFFLIRYFDLLIFSLCHSGEPGTHKTNFLYGLTSGEHSCC
jgi:hypothetical protein